MSVHRHLLALTQIIYYYFFFFLIGFDERVDREKDLDASEVQ